METHCTSTKPHLIVQKKTVFSTNVSPHWRWKTCRKWVAELQHTTSRPPNSLSQLHAQQECCRTAVAGGVAPDIPSCSRVEQSRQNFTNGIGCDGSRQVDNFSRNRDVDEFRCVFLVGILCSKAGVLPTVCSAVELCLLFSFPNVTVRQSDRTYW